MTPQTIQLLGTVATLYGLGGALSVLLQARQMHVRRSSGDVSARFLTVYVGGFAIWLLYGLGIGSIPIVVVHAVGLLCGTITLAVVIRLRGPAAMAATTQLAGEDHTRVQAGQPLPHEPERKSRPVGIRASRQTSPLVGSRSLDPTPHFALDPGAILVRPVAPGDEEGLRAMLHRLSPKSIYLRFHAPYPRVPEWAAAAFAQTNRRDGESLVAVAEGEIVGHAMYVQTDRASGKAEIAIVVEDRWQGQGVGKLLLFDTAGRAGERDIETFTGVVLGENRRMLGLVRSLFDGVRYPVREGACEVHASLRSLKYPTGPLGLSA